MYDTATGRGGRERGVSLAGGPVTQGTGKRRLSSLLPPRPRYSPTKRPREVSSDNIVLGIVPRNRRRGTPRPIIGLAKIPCVSGEGSAMFRKRPFNEFVDKVCERQRRHKVGGDVHLQFDVEQQSRLENWMEFQDYHLQLHEGFEKKRDELKKKLDDARKEAEGTSKTWSMQNGSYNGTRLCCSGLSRSE